MTTAANLTLDQFLALPDTEPASEYICGKAIQKPMPTDDHAFLQIFLGKVLLDYLEKNPIARAGTEWRCVLGPSNQERAFVPDLMVVRRDRIPRTTPRPRAFFGAPDLAIEILSPEQPAGPFADKLYFYLRNGVRLVWVVDPDAMTVAVYTPDEPSRILGVDDTLDGGDVLPGFTLSIADLFAQLDG